MTKKKKKEKFRQLLKEYGDNYYNLIEGLSGHRLRDAKRKETELSTQLFQLIDVSTEEDSSQPEETGMLRITESRINDSVTRIRYTPNGITSTVGAGDITTATDTISLRRALEEPNPSNIHMFPGERRVSDFLDNISLIDPSCDVVVEQSLLRACYANAYNIHPLRMIKTPSGRIWRRDELGEFLLVMNQPESHPQNHPSTNESGFFLQSPTNEVEPINDFYRTTDCFLASLSINEEKDSLESIEYSLPLSLRDKVIELPSGRGWLYNSRLRSWTIVTETSSVVRSRNFLIQRIAMGNTADIFENLISHFFVSGINTFYHHEDFSSVTTIFLRLLLLAPRELREYCNAVNDYVSCDVSLSWVEGKLRSLIEYLQPTFIISEQRSDFIGDRPNLQLTEPELPFTIEDTPVEPPAEENTDF
jgi:hypothetical protein